MKVSVCLTLCIFLLFLFNLTVLCGLDEPHSIPSGAVTGSVSQTLRIAICENLWFKTLWGKDGSREIKILGEPMRALTQFFFLTFVSVGCFQVQVT